MHFGITFGACTIASVSYRCMHHNTGEYGILLLLTLSTPVPTLVFDANGEDLITLKSNSVKYREKLPHN